MRKIILFINVSLDGYFEAPGHDITWTSNENEAFSPAQSDEVDTILLGRKTYEMMRAFWSTPQAEQAQPEIARFMNEKLKIVVAHRNYAPGWKNVTVLSEDVVGGVKKLKAQRGKNIIIFGSNQLCTTLLPAGLIDEFQILVNPVVLGGGSALFRGLAKKARMMLTATRAFKSGTVLLTYTAAKA